MMPYVICVRIPSFHRHIACMYNNWSLVFSFFVMQDFYWHQAASFLMRAGNRDQSRYPAPHISSVNWSLIHVMLCSTNHPSKLPFKTTLPPDKYFYFITCIQVDGQPEPIDPTHATSYAEPNKTSWKFPPVTLMAAVNMTFIIRLPSYLSNVKASKSPPEVVFAIR